MLTDKCSVAPIIMALKNAYKKTRRQAVQGLPVLGALPEPRILIDSKHSYSLAVSASA